MTVEQLIEHLKTLDPKATVLRHTGAGLLPLQEYQAKNMKVEDYYMERCYYRRTDFTEMEKLKLSEVWSLIQAVQLP